MFSTSPGGDFNRFYCRTKKVAGYFLVYKNYCFSVGVTRQPLAGTRLRE